MTSGTNSAKLVETIAPTSTSSSPLLVWMASANVAPEPTPVARGTTARRLAQDEVGGVGELERDRAYARRSSRGSARRGADRRRPRGRSRCHPVLDRDLADGQPDGDADGEPGGIELVPGLFGIAQFAGNAGEPISRPDDADPIAQGSHVMSETTRSVSPRRDPGRRHTEPVLEVELAEPFAGEPTIRHEHAAEVEGAAVKGEMTVAARADVPAERRHGRAWADHDERVAGNGTGKSGQLRRAAVSTC